MNFLGDLSHEFVNFGIFFCIELLKTCGNKNSTGLEIDKPLMNILLLFSNDRKNLIMRCVYIQAGFFYPTWLVFMLCFYDIDNP